jgi:hypothetical protein
VPDCTRGVQALDRAVQFCNPKHILLQMAQIYEGSDKLGVRSLR